MPDVRRFRPLIAALLTLAVATWSGLAAVGQNRQAADSVNATDNRREGDAEPAVVVTAASIAEILSPASSETPTAIQAVEVTTDGRRVISATSKGEIKAWSLSTGKLASSFAAHRDEIVGMVAPPEANLVVSCCNDLNVRVHDIESGELLRSISGRPGLRMSTGPLACAPNGRVFASAFIDKTVRLWSLPDGDPLHTFAVESAYPWTLAFSPDGRYLVAGYRDALKTWAGPDGRVVASKPAVASGSSALAVSPKGDLLATTVQRMFVQFWKFPQLARGEIVDVPELNAQPNLLFSPDGRTLILSGVGGRIHLLSIEQLELVGSLDAADDGDVTEVTSLALHPQGNLLFAGTSNRHIVVWDLTSNKRLGYLVDEIDVR